MQINGINGFNNLHQVREECKSVAKFVSSLRYKPTYTLVQQEVNRIVLRSLAVKYLLKTYFGKGNFDWRDPYQVATKAYKLLAQYPLPQEVWDFLEVKEEGSVYVGILRRMLKVDPQELRAKPDDSAPVLEAKREAFLTDVALHYERAAYGRAPNWREFYGDEVNQYWRGIKGSFPPWAGKEFYGWAWKDPGHYDRTLGIIETHKPYVHFCVWAAIKKYVLEPELPFDVELPDFGKI